MARSPLVGALREGAGVWDLERDDGGARKPQSRGLDPEKKLEDIMSGSYFARVFHTEKR
jgi:hypothetical protein